LQIGLLDWRVRKRLLLQINQRTPWTSVLSRKVLWKVRNVLRGLGSLDDAVLWGSWARYLVTSNEMFSPRDVDLIVSDRLSKRFYELAVALRREGFHPILRIPDPELDKALKSAGLSQEPVRKKHGGSHQWGLSPKIRNFTLRKYLGVNLDLLFGPDSFEATPGHSTWIKDGTQDRLIRSVGFWAGSELLFDNPVQTKMGLLVPSLDAQIQFSRMLFNRELDLKQGERAKKVAIGLTQLEEAREQRRLD
jgi:hypothetical protein